MPVSRCRGLVLVGLLGLVMAGCGGPRLAKVAGHVRVDGQPVTAGIIMFHPADGPTAVGNIEPDGSYALTTLAPGDGAVIGTHRVTIQATRVSAGHLAPPKNIDEEIARSRSGGGLVLVPGTVTWVVPESCSQPDTSGLTAEVKRGANTIDFDIPNP